MKSRIPKDSLKVAIKSALLAGRLIQRNCRKLKTVKEDTLHDIKLDLDVQAQDLIESILFRAFKDIPVVGEEKSTTNIDSEFRWVVDPIDGTVNYAYGIPHVAVAIALQRCIGNCDKHGKQYLTELGVVYDPFKEELWTAERNKVSRLNGKIIHVSTRSQLSDCIIAVGFARFDSNFKKILPQIEQLGPKVKKIRIMGSAALDLVYVASGRLDAYWEAGVRLWDIAAGGLILECAGGQFEHALIQSPHFYHILATNKLITSSLKSFIDNAFLISPDEYFCD